MLQTFWGIRVWKLICICNWTPQNVSNYVYSLQTMIFLISSWPWLLTNKLILQTLPTYITSWEDFKLLSSKSSFCYRPILLGSRIMFLFFSLLLLWFCCNYFTVWTGVYKYESVSFARLDWGSIIQWSSSESSLLSSDPGLNYIGHNLIMYMFFSCSCCLLPKPMQTTI